MGYLRKVMATGLAIVFMIALVIGTGVIFSVRNVNVTYLDYSDAYFSEYEKCRNGLDKIKGTSLLFLNEETITENISNSDHIALKSYKKVFPCTVNVVLKERVERYALKNESGYAVYDTDGKYIKSCAGEAVPLNALDMCPDVVLNVSLDSLEELIKLCNLFDEGFGPARKLLASVGLDSYFDFGLQIALFKLRSGITVSVSNWTENGRQKVEMAYSYYCTLTDAQKLCGTITVVDAKDNSGVIAKYAA